MNIIDPQKIIPVFFAREVVGDDDDVRIFWIVKRASHMKKQHHQDQEAPTTIGAGGFADRQDHVPFIEDVLNRHRIRDDDHHQASTTTTKSNPNNKRRKDSAIAGQAEDKQERITKLKGLLDRHRSEFCLSYNTCTGNVTTIELATFFAQGITNNTPCAS